MADPYAQHYDGSYAHRDGYYSTMEPTNAEYHVHKEVVMSESGADLPQALHANAMPQPPYVPPTHQDFYFGPKLVERPSQTTIQYSPVGFAAPSLIETASSEEKGLVSSAPSSRERQRRRKCGLVPWLFWTLVSIIVVGILGAIAGGVAGGLLADKHKNEAVSGSSGGTNSTSVNNTTSRAAAVLDTSRLAAVNWTDADQQTHYAVFWQDTDNALLASLWDSRNQTWKAVNISSAMAASKQTVTLRPGTPIAAVASSPPDNEFEVVVFFVTPSSILTSITTKDPAAKSWSLGDLMKGPPRGIDVDSSLASVWHQCKTGDGCIGNILVAFQSGGALMVLNSTDWTTPDMGLINYSPKKGTPLTFFMVFGSEVRLYFQQTGLNVAEIKLNPQLEWSFGFSPNQGVSTPGIEQMAGSCYASLRRNFVVSLNQGGSLRGYIWDDQAWVGNQPMTITNQPESTNTTFGAIAQHSQQRLYTTAGGTLQEYRWDAADPLTVMYAGTVTLQPES